MEDLSTLVLARMAATPGMTRRQAIAAIAHEKPESHRAFLAKGAQLRQPTGPRAGRQVAYKIAPTGQSAPANSAGFFGSLVEVHMAAHPTLERRRAIVAMAKAHPEAHKAFVASCPRAQ